MIKLAVAGAGGRMGGEIMRAIARAEGVEASVALEHAASAAVGKDAGEIAGCGAIGVVVGAGLSDAPNNHSDSNLINSAGAADFDLMIEFTTPAATLEHVERCRQWRRGMLIGTTGLSADEQKRIRQAASDIPILLAANTSIGITLCAALLAIAAKTLGPISDIEIIEAHHRHKVDAPSGTALLLGEAVAAALDKDLDKDGVFTRHGHTGARKSGSIGFSAIRGGDLAGEHTVMFIGDGERVEITHKATDRKIFADGAIAAAKWLAGRPPGLYSMRDALGLGGDAG